jgi:dTDP-4-dehydrorhamnose reductase
MRIALVGAHGQLGSDLQQTLAGNIILLGHEDIEITDQASVEGALSAARPECVINSAAYNLVDRAEDEPLVAYAVNALGPRNLAKYCAAHDLPLLHVSTDYVFGNQAAAENCAPHPYVETDAPGPINAYGVSKLAGEYFVRSLCPRHYVVRTCGLYGRKATRGKGNFVETMLRLGRERGEVSVVADQHCTPTATADLARAIAALVETGAYGLYHATNTGAATWYHVAAEAFRLAKLDARLRPITTAEFPTKAPRPGYTLLATDKLAATIGWSMPPWQDALARYLAARP